GGAGFIGSHLTERLLREGHEIVVIDNFNDYYDPSVKRENISSFVHNPSYSIVEGDIRDVKALEKVWSGGQFDIIVHLAAMAGVRPSLEQPALYMDVNVVGTQNLLDKAMAQPELPQFVFGSSSSVYGERSAE